jgi:isoprene synthase
MQDQRYKDRAKKLEEDVGSMINNENADLLETLELIDDLQRLGLGYRFERDITRTLDNFASSKLCNEGIEKSLHATALSFRLLRQQGYQVSQGKKKYIYIYIPTYYIMLILYIFSYSQS